MSKVAHYLQEHLLGEVTASLEVRRHFATDASILTITPQLVVYPRNEADVRKTARFAWQLAQRGRSLPVTARGGGTNTSGAAIGSGILVVFPAHMSRILALNPAKALMAVEPGVVYDKLEQTLYTHGLFLPSYPSSVHQATIGGGLATNVVGEKSLKYGVTADYVQQMRVVLANGEIIETGDLSKRELSHKLGLSTFEGEIYRALDTLLEENASLLAEAKSRLKARHHAVGYNLFNVKKSHHFDLTPLFVGSQGTLGLITEATLSVAPHTPVSSLAMVSLENIDDLYELLPKILELKPSLCDMVNRAAITQISKLNPNLLNNVLDNAKAAIHLFVEFDEPKESDQKKAVKHLRKLVEKAGGICYVAHQTEAQERIWKVHQAVATFLTQPHGHSKAVPVAEDVCVPVGSLTEYLKKAQQIYESFGLPAAAWGHAGSGIVHMRPVLDLAQIGDRQTMFKLADTIYSEVIKLGGSISASAGDGRVRAPYLRDALSDELYNLTHKVKKIFDPYNILNPGVKTATFEDVKALMREDYSPSHHYEYLPKS